MNNLPTSTLIKLAVLYFFAVALVGVAYPDSVEDEYIPAEIHMEKCLTWREHQEKYPSIKGVNLLSSMVKECAR